MEPVQGAGGGGPGTSSAEPARLEAYPDAVAEADAELDRLARELDAAMAAFDRGAGELRPANFDPGYEGHLVRTLRDESQYLAAWVAQVGLGFRIAGGDGDGDGVFEADDARLDGLVGPASMYEAMRIPPPGTDPAEVAHWWSLLPREVRDRLIEEHCSELGQLRGLPAEDADRVNRLRLERDLTNLSERLRNVELTISGLQHTPSGHVDPELYRQRDELRAELANAQKVARQMQDLDHRHPPGPPAYLLTYEAEGNGRFAVALGNPDTADNTGIVVPGTGHDVRHEGGLFGPVGDGQRLYDQMNSADPGADNAVIVWMGADMPDEVWPSALNGTYGDIEHGAAWLRDDVAGYRAAHMQASGGSPGHTTVVAHSYGSYMTGEALEHGMQVDDFVSVGSAGIDADGPAALGMSRDHVWGAAAPGDPVPDIEWHGQDPADEEFGGTVIATNDSEGHSEYYKEGSQSLANLGRIAVGHYDDVELRPPD
ncbi:MAG TPA: alpha/beta hydrolase [Acidimicrobiales bacterium]